MRISFLVILVFVGVFSFAVNPPGISEVRESFYNGWAGECGASHLYNQLHEFELEDPVLVAYKGAAEMTLANCVGNPWKKYQYFKSGKSELEAVINQEPDNFEIRYLRFAVKINLPSILNYNNIEEDKQFLIERLILQVQNTTPDAYMNFVLDQMIQSEELSPEEKSKLNFLISKH